MSLDRKHMDDGALAARAVIARLEADTPVEGSSWRRITRRSLASSRPSLWCESTSRSSSAAMRDLTGQPQRSVTRGGPSRRLGAQPALVVGRDGLGLVG